MGVGGDRLLQGFSGQRPGNQAPDVRSGSGGGPHESERLGCGLGFRETA